MFIVKLDLLQGYHQIPISSKSRNLFCFALEGGLYRYCRAPMGYKGSSNYFNRIVQKIFEDITSTHIEVDDILSEGETIEECLATLKQILLRCREWGIKLARHKLEFGREVDFAGTHIGGKDGFRPTTAKIEGIINMSHPTNITELRSFLGAYNQLCMYLPDFAHTVEDMHKLLKKDTPFVWDVTLQKQFEKIKEILKSPLGLKPFNKSWETIMYTDYSSKGVGYALI